MIYKITYIIYATIFLCYSCDNCLSEAQTISDIKEILENTILKKVLYHEN